MQKKNGELRFCNDPRKLNLRTVKDAYSLPRIGETLKRLKATFQRLMESCLGDLNLNWCIINPDDVVVFASSVKEHLGRLKAMLQKLKLKPSKCDLFKKSISYLGHVVSEEVVRTDPR